jgi:hypothetical protein
MSGVSPIKAVKSFQSAAEKTLNQWANSSKIARVAASVLAGVGIVGSAAIAPKAATFLRKSNVAKSNDTKPEVSKSGSTETEKKTKISRFEQIKQNMIASAKSAIASIKAHPYEAAAVTAGFVVAGMAVRQKQLDVANKERYAEVGKLFARMPGQLDKEPVVKQPSREFISYADELRREQAAAKEAIQKALASYTPPEDLASDCIVFDRFMQANFSPVEPPKIVPFGKLDKLKLSVQRSDAAKSMTEIWKGIRHPQTYKEAIFGGSAVGAVVGVTGSIAKAPVISATRAVLDRLVRSFWITPR